MSSPPIDEKPNLPSAGPTGPDHFKDSGSARKAMLALKAPISDDSLAVFLGKITKSPLSRQIAFVLLSEGWKSKQTPIWSVLRAKLKDILAEGRTFPSADVMSNTETRKKWIAAEFGITGRIQDSAKFNASFGYLWPLFVILSFPDNETWLGQSLGDFLAELEASIEVGKGNSGAPRKSGGGSDLSRSIALNIVPQVQKNALSIKLLKSHLQLAQKASLLPQRAISTNEFSARQIETLDRLLTEEKAKHLQIEEQLAQAEKALAEAKVEAVKLKEKLNESDRQKDMQRGLAEMRMNEALVEQRAQLRFKLREGLVNIKLYADRAEPAKERILKLCDDLITHLDGAAG
jgi:hypothetical protein